MSKVSPVNTWPAQAPQRVAVFQLYGRRLDAATRRCRRLRTRVLQERGCAGDVVGVGMGFDDVAQLDLVLGQHSEVTGELCVDGVDDDGFSALRVNQQIGEGAGGGVKQLNGTGCEG
jgi:hypothetical protein